MSTTGTVTALRFLTNSLIAKKYRSHIGSITIMGFRSTAITCWCWAVMAPARRRFLLSLSMLDPSVRLRRLGAARPCRLQEPHGWTRQNHALHGTCHTAASRYYVAPLRASPY